MERNSADAPRKLVAIGWERNDGGRLPTLLIRRAQLLFAPLRATNIPAEAQPGVRNITKALARLGSFSPMHKSNLLSSPNFKERGWRRTAIAVRLPLGRYFFTWLLRK
jgi:hypothetical protein